MDILIRILMGLEAIVCLMLIGIVLIQRSKGQGVGLSFGGGAEAVFGAQMGNVLTRTTVILAAIFIVNTTLLVVLRPKGRSASVAERFAPVAAPVQAASSSDEAAALELMNDETPVAPAADVPNASAPVAPAEVVPDAPAPAVVVPAAAPAAVSEVTPTP